MDFLCALFTRNNNRPDNFKHTGCGGCEANKSNEFPTYIQQLHSRAREPSIVYTG